MARKRFRYSTESLMRALRHHAERGAVLSWVHYPAAGTTTAYPWVIRLAGDGRRWDEQHYPVSDNECFLVCATLAAVEHRETARRTRFVDDGTGLRPVEEEGA